jgi:DNA polymerase-3 subunit delta'
MDNVYPWLQPLWQRWQGLSLNNRVPGALLCTASEGMGMSELLRHFCRTLMCSNSESEPCGFCHACSLSASDNHPDIHWVAPERAGKALTVDQIRECNRWAMESSQLGGKRIIVITPAEAMNESASNALLKTLESPPANCLFILSSHNKAKLLPTIVSRCQHWDVAEPDIEVTSRWLQGQTEKPVSYNGIRLAHGAPLKALAFFLDGGYEQFLALESLFGQELRKPFPDMTALVKAITADSQTSLMWLSVLLTDVQKVHFSVTEGGMCATSSELAKLIAYQVAYDGVHKLNTLRDQLSQFTGLNAELLVTDWILQLHEDICS